MDNLLLEGFGFSSMGVALMLIFEFGISSSDVQRLRKRDGGKELHAAGLRATIINHLVLGPIFYYITLRYCCTQRKLTLLQQAIAVFNFLVIENVLFYCGHFLMHTRYFYWMHRFHHRFNTIVLPSSASAVSTSEFVCAYMTPFVLAAWGASCDRASAVNAARIVILANLIIHTPSLEKMNYYPWLLVSPSDHLAHHRQLTGNYSAPIFHCERIFASIKDIMYAADKAIRSRLFGSRVRG